MRSVKSYDGSRAASMLSLRSRMNRPSELVEAFAGLIPTRIQGFPSRAWNAVREILRCYGPVA